MPVRHNHYNHQVHVSPVHMGSTPAGKVLVRLPGHLTRGCQVHDESLNSENLLGKQFQLCQRRHPTEDAWLYSLLPGHHHQHAGDQQPQVPPSPACCSPSASRLTTQCCSQHLCACSPTPSRTGTSQPLQLLLAASSASCTSSLRWSDAKPLMPSASLSTAMWSPPCSFSYVL